jgi:hypothetical protein
MTHLQLTTSRQPKLRFPLNQHSFAAGLGLVGTLFACGGDSPVDPGNGNGGPSFGAPRVELSVDLDGDRAPLPYSFEVCGVPEQGQRVDRLEVSLPDTTFSVDGSCYSGAGVFENRSSGVASREVRVRAFPDKGPVGSASSVVSVRPEYASDRFSVRTFPRSFFGADGRAVTVPGVPLEARLVFPDGTVVESDSSGVAVPVGVEPGDYLVSVVADGRPRQELTVRFGYGGVVPIDVGLSTERFDLMTEFMHPAVESTFLLPDGIDRFIHRWERPLDGLMVADWAIGRDSLNQVVRLTPDVVGDSVATSRRMPAHQLQSVRNHARVMPQYVPNPSCVVPVFFEPEYDGSVGEFPDFTALADFSASERDGKILVGRSMGNVAGVIDRGSSYSAPFVVRSAVLLADATVDNISQRAYSNDLHESTGMRHPRTSSGGNNRDLQNVLLDNHRELGYIPTGNPRDALLEISRVWWNVAPGSGLRIREGGERVFYINNSSSPVSNSSSHASWPSCDTDVVLSDMPTPYEY